VSEFSISLDCMGHCCASKVSGIHIRVLDAIFHHLSNGRKANKMPNWLIIPHLPYPDSIIPPILIANLPQVVASFKYLIYNGLRSCMLAGREWSRYAVYTYVTKEHNTTDSTDVVVQTSPSTCHKTLVLTEVDLLHSGTPHMGNISCRRQCTFALIHIAKLVCCSGCHVSRRCPTTTGGGNKLKTYVWLIQRSARHRRHTDGDGLLQHCTMLVRRTPVCLCACCLYTQISHRPSS
jgi:hypothetical protein